MSDRDAPNAVTGQYLPALDGLRAVAVAGVIAYHLGLGWASGGYLGVDLFFVLSGFLITEPALGGVGGHGEDPAGRLLGPAGPAAVARPLPPAGGPGALRGR